MEKLTTHYDVRVLGQLWQPGVTAAQHLTIAGDREWLVEDVMQAADAQLGDFSQVTAWDIRRVVVEDSFRGEGPGKLAGRTYDRMEVEHRRTFFTQLVSFTDEEEATWHECMGLVDYEDV